MIVVGTRKRTLANYTHASNPATTLLHKSERQRRGVADAERWAPLRAL
jgi:hypothetical protein